MASFEWPPQGSGGGSGTVTSVALADGSSPTIFTIGGSPVTSSGTLTLTLSNESANTVLAGPSSGSAAQPTFRSLVLADLPSISTLTLLGNNTGGSSVPIALTVAQVNLILPVFTSTLNGLVPFSGGGTTNYLRADGTWDAPPGTINGTVTTVSIVSTNGFAGTVANATTTPAITLTTSITGILKGNFTAISQAAVGTDYSAGTSALATGILKSTTTTGALTIAVAADFPTLNQNTSGTAANITATSNSTLTTLSALSLPGSQVTGNIAGDAANVTGTVAIANGGTGQTTANPAFNALSPMTTAGDIIYEDATPTAARLAIGSTGNVLTVSGGLPVWAPPPSGSPVVPTVQRFLTTGTTTGWLFTVVSANATVGATYTNNTNTFTVLQTIAATTLLFTSGVGPPSNIVIGGVLTLTSGTGDATITFNIAQALATYTTPTSPTPLYIDILSVGAGGGGAGVTNTANSFNQGSSGGVSAFGTNLIIAGFGGGGTGNVTQLGGSGGVNIINSGPIVLINQAGQQGQMGNGATSGGNGSVGGSGGSNPLGGFGNGANYPDDGGGGTNGIDGQSAIANTGGGGGGGTVVAQLSGDGGGAGGYILARIASPASTYFYSVGVGGTGGPPIGGLNPGFGGSGGSGLIVIEEFYQ
jgi:hypothetical protein